MSSKREREGETFVTKRPKNGDMVCARVYAMCAFGMHGGERSTREIRGKAYRGNEFLLALGPPRQDRATDTASQGKTYSKRE